MQSLKQRRILPPDVDENVTFGIMWIRIGKLKLNTKKNLHEDKVLIQFWGEKVPVCLQTKSNQLNKNEQNTMIQYDIKCPVTFFKEYLMDMKKNLKLEVQGAGKIDFDITKFIKPNVDLSSRYVFDHFKGSFEILGKNNRKVGSVEIEMACNFNPQIAALELQQEANSNQQQIDEERKFKVDQKIISPGIDKNLAIDILAVENPQLLKQFYEQTIKQDKNKRIDRITSPGYQELRDDRIPNSLNTQMSGQKFNPNKYMNQIENKDGQLRNEKKSIQKITDKSRQKQQISQNKLIKVQDQISNFPTITKVLTYSNLRLAKQQSQKQTTQQKNILKQNISGIKYQKIQQKDKQSLNKLQDQFYGNNQQKYQNKFNSNQKKNEHSKKFETEQKQEIYSEIQKREQQEQSNLLQEEKQVLSRVVNLDEELKKSEINSPTKNKQKNSSLHQSISQNRVSVYKENTINPKQNYSKPKQNIVTPKQNDIRPITQYRTHVDFFAENKPQNHQINSPISHQHFQGTMRQKPSTLVLNIIVQIQTKSIIFFKKKQKFCIVHRPYGSKERIKLGPKFQSQKVIIMCPVTQQLVIKMDKLPFIVQFWGAISNQFLGFFKINLNKIKKGFILQGRLNQIAVKSSLMPIIVQNGQISIQNINGQKEGECNIYAGIGTSSQIQLFLNSSKKYSHKNNQNVPENIRPKQFNKKNNQNQGIKKLKDLVSDQNIELNSCDGMLTHLLNYVDKNSSKNITILAEFMKKKQLGNQEFEEFILRINQDQQKIKEITYIFRHFDPQSLERSQKYIQAISFKRSFDQYKQIILTIQKQFSQINRTINKRIFPGVKQEIIKKSSFNIIQKQNFIEIYFKSLKNNASVSQGELQFERSLVKDYFVDFFQQYINLDVLFATQKVGNVYQPTFKMIIKSVIANFLDLLWKHNSTIQNLQAYLDVQPESHKLIKKLWNFSNDKLSSKISSFSPWYWVCLFNGSIQGKQVSQKYFISRLHEQYERNQKLNFIKEKIGSEIQIDNTKKAFDSKSPKYKPIIEKDKFKGQIEKNNSQSMTESNINKILNLQEGLNAGNMLLNNQFHQVQIRSEENNVFIQKQQEGLNDSDLGHLMEVQKHAKSLKCHEHAFMIKGVQLYLQNAFDGQCQISYLFPYDDEPIGSKKIQLFKNKHKYTISLYGQHKITIDNDISTYLNQIPLKFQLLKLTSDDQGHHQILLQGDLHPDEIVLQENSTIETKIVPLFGEDSQKMQGKIKLQIQYKVKETEKQNLGKQTVFNVFLPKTGFVNFDFKVKVQEQKIRSQFHLDQEQFYLAIVLDMFPQNRNLKPHYPPISSKLFSDLKEQVQFKNSIKLSLNPVILQYLKQKSSIVSLNIIYYSKEKGNYEKKQTTFATLKIPLFNLIKEEGIQGNYAFKNKYGMFAGLGKLEMKYERHQKKQIQSQLQQGLAATSSKNKESNFWIIIHFKELINFQPNTESTFVKFETVFAGTKYQTQKIHLSEDSLLLFNDYIALRLSQEEFLSTKILPISILFDRKQKLALDINLKPIAKKLSTHKYFVNGSYFLVVDQNSQMTKIRVGARVIVFKGNSLIEPFVTALCNNLDIDVLSQIDIPRDIENYAKLLEIFRNQLKLSKKSFQECIKHILSSKNEKLSFELMSSQLCYKLDLMPIIAQSQEQVDSIARNLDGVTRTKDILQYITQNSYNFTNLHEDILARYSFQNLSTDKIDKNVQYFNLAKQIDLLTLVRKIKVIDQTQQINKQGSGNQRTYKQLRITLQRGVNLHYLYNGIKPNIVIKIPQLGYQSKLKLRSSQPVFNQTLRQIVQSQNEAMYRHLEVQAYHIASSKGQQEQILIGSGSFNIHNWIHLSNPIHQSEQKQAKVVLSSTMSSKMKATLEITLKINLLGQNEYEANRKEAGENYPLEDASRIEQMIKDINKQMDSKKHLFDQSSDDDQY